MSTNSETYGQRIARILENLPEATAGELNEVIQAGERASRVDYWRDVRGVVEDVRQAVASGELEDEDAADQYIWEAVDGHSRVIYTHEAKRGLAASDNEDAHEEETGEQTADVSVRMFWAMRRDVMDELGDLAELFEDTDEDDDEDAPGL